MERCTNYIIKAVLLISGLLCGLTSCDREELPRLPEKPELPENEKIAVNFTISWAGFGNSTSPQTPLQESGAKEEFKLPPFSGEMVGASASLRAAIALNPDTRVRIVQYIVFNNDTLYIDNAEYEVYTGIALDLVGGGSGLMVSPGLKYLFTAYSFNNDTPMPAYDPVATLDFPDILWGTSDTVTFTPTAQDMHITMHHLQSLVVVNAVTDLGRTNTLNDIEAEIECFDNATLNVKTGTLNPNGGLIWKPVSWTITNPLQLTQKSDSLYVLTDGVSNTHLRINKMVIDYIPFDDTINIVYPNPLESGKSYTLQLKFSWARGGSADRITWDSATGRYAITRDPTNAGLYFKFGSVVGLYSDVEGSVGKILTLPGKTNSTPPTDTVFLASRDIAWSPYAKVASDLWNWIDVPAYAPGDYPQYPLINHETGYHSVANVKVGKGDPCRLVGLDLENIRNKTAGSLSPGEIDNRIWRLPTVQENEWFTEGSIGSVITDHWWTYTGSSLVPSYPVSPFGPGVAGAEFPHRITSTFFAEGRAARFLPAVGARDFSSGHAIIASQGNIAYYWSNQAIDDPVQPICGVSLFITPFNVYLYPDLPNASVDDTEWGFSVRCVRQSLDIKVTAVPWVDEGELNTGNEGKVKL